MVSIADQLDAFATQIEEFNPLGAAHGAGEIERDAAAYIRQLEAEVASLEACQLEFADCLEFAKRWAQLGAPVQDQMADTFFKGEDLDAQNANTLKMAWNFAKAMDRKFFHGSDEALNDYIADLAQHLGTPLISGDTTDKRGIIGRKTRYGDYFPVRHVTTTKKGKGRETHHGC